MIVLSRTACCQISNESIPAPNNANQLGCKFRCATFGPVICSVKCQKETTLRAIIFTLMILLLTSLAIAEPVEIKPPQTKVLGSATGRYVFGQISDFRADQFLLDTESGGAGGVRHESLQDGSLIV